jgi:ankyrin repeat protein
VKWVGELNALAELRPTRTEVEEPIPGAGTPLAVAVVTSQPSAADWILERRPDLASKAIEPTGATLLHSAVEWDDEALVRVALDHGADPSVRDSTHGGTPLDWARHFGRPALAEVLSRATP